MAAAEQTTLNENLKTMMESSDVKISETPVPAQRRNKTRAEESTVKADNTLSVSTIIDNSRVVFVDKDITKNEVHITNEPKLETSDVSKSNTPVVTMSAQSKSKIASVIEKFNSNNSNPRVNVVICKVDVCDAIDIPPVNNEVQLDDKSKTPEVVNCEIPLNNIVPVQNTAKMKENDDKINDSKCVSNGYKEKTDVSKYNKELTEKVESVLEQTKDIKVPIPAPRTFTLKNKILESQMIHVNESFISTSNTISEKSTNIVVVETSSNKVEAKTSSHETLKGLGGTVNKNATTNTSGNLVTNINSNEEENNKILSQTKPTISKKPTTLSDYRMKTEKVQPPCKIPVFEKSLSFQDRDLKNKGLRSPAEKNSLEFEPKLTKSQRTSSEQCLSSLKGDGDTSIRKLRVYVEQLQQENAVLKKLLESERSALREQKAVFESESRKEKAEAKRREASLESQVRAALKGQTVTAVGPANAGVDNARYVAALDSAKTTIKALQEKLRVAWEADKKKALEIRAQHDAHNAVVQQMERDARTQTAKLLEELKSKERQMEKAKKEVKVIVPSASPGKPQTKMAVSEQLHQMEGQISRLENEIQRRDDIINSLKTSKIQREKRLSQRISKDNIFKDMLSDVDSAVSSAPNSLSPQPSPDLWYRLQDASQVEVDEGLLEAAKKQIQELEKALNLSTTGQKQAQSKVAQLEEQLQDLREHADLLEFRCLELEDSVEKRHSLEELTDSDSGCTSPENRLKNSVSPQLRRSDSGYKSPTRSVSPTVKNSQRLNVPAPFPEHDAMLTCTENYKAIVNNLHLQSLESIFENGYSNEEVRDRLEGIILKTNSKNDRLCLEQILQLLWNLQALGSSLKEDDFSVVKNKKSVENDLNKCDLEQQIKSGKIIATVSPYSQKALSKSNNDLNKSCNEVDLGKLTLKEESRKLLFGLQESGIFEEGDWESKSTQTECYDCVCPESESDLATEVLRLNQIREQLEKSGAIKNKNAIDSCHDNTKHLDLKQRRRDKKKIELYENRILVLENKISIYESSADVREKRLAQRLQREIDLQSKVKNLDFDLAKLKKRYIYLEQEKCEFEELENETRLQCQELEAEFDILTAKLRDLDDQRNCARNESECYRQLMEEYEYKIMTMQNHEKELEKKAETYEKLIPVLLTYNTFCAMKASIEKSQCSCHASSNGSSSKPTLMIQYPDTNGESSKCGAQKRPLLCICENAGNSVSPNDASTQYEDPDELRRQITEEENKLKMRIEELEKRELAYLETLTKGDEMWAEMETSYKQKLKESEDNENHLLTSLKKWKSKVEEKEKKIHEMEENEEIWKTERKAFMDDLREVKKVKDDLDKKNKRLVSEISESRMTLEEREREYKASVNSLKHKAEYTRSELEEQRRLNTDSEREYSMESIKLKNDLRKTYEELDGYKHSVKDLSDVVKTLRESLQILETEMRTQRSDFEAKMKQMLREIKGKSDEVESLKGSLARFDHLPSAKDELDDINKTNYKSVEEDPNDMQMRIKKSVDEDRNDTQMRNKKVYNESSSSRQQPDNRNDGESYNEQATTLITIKAIKHPASQSRNGECRCNTADAQTYRDRSGPSFDSRVTFRKDDDCNLLYGDIMDRHSNHYGGNNNMSGINLFNMDGTSVGSVPSGYKAKKSPESFNIMSDANRKSNCQSAGRPSRDLHIKPGNDRRSTSCNCSKQTNAPPVSCYCCGCKEIVDNFCKHEPLPLLLLTKSANDDNHPSKSKSCKAGSKKPHDKKAGHCAGKKRENACKTSEKSTSFHSDFEGLTQVECDAILKPDVPCRKPKLPSKPKCHKKKNFENSLAPPNLKELRHSGIEESVCKMLSQSLESCLDAKTYVVCQQVSKLEEVNKALILHQKSLMETPKNITCEETKSVTPPTNKAINKNNIRKSINFSSKELPLERSRINRLCMTNKMGNSLMVKPPSPYLPKNKNNTKEATKSNVKNDKKGNGIVRFESNIKLVQKCSISYETRKNVKRIPFKKNLEMPKLEPQNLENAKHQKVRKGKNPTKVAVKRDRNPFVVSSEGSVASSAKGRHNEKSKKMLGKIKNEMFGKDSVMQDFMNRFLAAPLREEMTIQEVYGVSSSMIGADSIVDLSILNCSASSSDIVEDDKTKDYLIEIVNKSSNTETKPSDCNLYPNVPSTPELSCDQSSFIHKTFSKMSLVLIKPSIKPRCLAINIKSRLLFSGRYRLIKDRNICQQKTKLKCLPRNISSNGISFSMTYLPTKTLQSDNLKKTSSLILDPNTCQVVFVCKSIYGNIYNETSNNKSISKTKILSENAFGTCDFCKNNKLKRRSLDNMKRPIENVHSSKNKSMSESELYMSKLKICTENKREHNAFSHLIEKLYNESDEGVDSDVKPDKVAVEEKNCDNIATVKDSLDQSAYDSSSKEIIPFKKISLKKTRKIRKIRKSFKLLARRALRTKVTIKMKKSHTIESSMMIDSDLSGVLSKINAEIVTAVEMVDKEALNTLSNLSIQFSDTLFKMKALQEDSLRSITLSSNDSYDSNT